MAKERTVLLKRREVNWQDIALRAKRLAGSCSANRQLFRESVRNTRFYSMSLSCWRSSPKKPISCLSSWNGFSSRRASRMPMSSRPRTMCRLRGQFFIAGTLILILMWAHLRDPDFCWPLDWACYESWYSMTPGARISAAIEVLRRHRNAQKTGRRCAEGLGSFASFRGLQGSRGDRFARLRRGAQPGLVRLHHGRAKRPARSFSALCARSAAWTPSALAALCSGEAHAPPPLDARETERLAQGRSERCARVLSRVIFRNGWSLPSPPSSGKASSPR